MSVRFNIPEEKSKLSTPRHHDSGNPDISEPLLLAPEEDNSSDHQFQIKPRETFSQNLTKSIMVVTGQGGVDLDDVFGFEKKDREKRLTVAKRLTKVFGEITTDKEDEEVDLFAHLPTWFAYYVLGQSVLIGSIMIPWITWIPSDKLLRISWRLGFQAMMLIPWVLYEKRNVTERWEHIYNFKYIFSPENFFPVFIAGINMGLQFGAQLTSFGWTFMCHSFLFVSMTNFWLSIFRWYRSEVVHFTEKCGRVVVILGVLVINYDSCTFDETPYLPFQKDYINNFVFHRQAWQRVLFGNIMPMMVSCLMSYNSRFTAEIKNKYPPFLSLFMISSLGSFFVFMDSYFLDGTSLSFDKFWGYFGLFTEGNFSNYMYMSFILTFGLFTSSIFISKLYEPIIPASSALIEPIGTNIFNHASYVQMMPSAVGWLGYFLVPPGQFLILLGQYFQGKEKEYNDKMQAEIKAQVAAQIAAHNEKMNTLKPPERSTLAMKGETKSAQQLRASMAHAHDARPSRAVHFAEPANEKKHN